jgi:hypothetical protein
MLGRPTVTGAPFLFSVLSVGLVTSKPPFDPVAVLVNVKGQLVVLGLEIAMRQCNSTSALSSSFPFSNSFASGVNRSLKVKSL